MIFLATNRLRQNVSGRELGPVIGDHVRWTKAQLERGTLIQAGRWGESGGVAVVRAEGPEAASRLMAQDPLVVAGLVDLEIRRFHPDVETAHFTDVP